MRYENVKRGRFISRPNRFIAHVEVDGEIKVCHVKNTGRCRELLTDGATVILDRPTGRERKTEYDLVAVYKGDLLINMDSQAPNKVFGEWAESSGYFGDAPTVLGERVYGDSRLDFYIESGERRIYAEVKGVTLEQDGVVMFPDAPTERGIKHLRELTRAVSEGYEAYAVFIVQMERCLYFTPNRATHPQFADALVQAEAAGVKLLALTCEVEEDSLTVRSQTEVRL